MKENIDPQTLIRPNATWTPGAWTPARCELWRQFDGSMKQRLEKWVSAERQRKTCHASQLPDMTTKQEAA